MKEGYKNFYNKIALYAGVICLLISVASCVSETEKRQLDSLRNEVAWMEAQIEELDRQETEKISEKARQDSIQKEEKTKLKPSHILVKDTSKTFWFSPDIPKNLMALGFTKGQKKEKTVYVYAVMDITSIPLSRNLDGNTIKVKEIYYGEEDGDEDYYVTVDFSNENSRREFLDEIRKNFNPKDNGDKLILNASEEYGRIIIDCSNPSRLAIYSENCSDFPRL